MNDFVIKSFYEHFISYSIYFTGKVFQKQSYLCNIKAATDEFWATIKQERPKQDYHR